MAQFADITVKAADGTTNVVYTGFTPSSGDKTPARWRANAAHAIPAFRPTFELMARPSGNSGSTRRVEYSGKYPVIQAINGIDTLVFTVLHSGDLVLPQGVPQTAVKESIYQFTNLLAAALIRQCFEEAQAPT